MAEPVDMQVKVSVNTYLWIFVCTIGMVFWSLLIFKFGIAEGFSMTQKSFYVENYIGSTEGLIPSTEVKKIGKSKRQ